MTGDNLKDSQVFVITLDEVHGSQPSYSSPKFNLSFLYSNSAPNGGALIFLWVPFRGRPFCLFFNIIDTI
jgi:hypothetical protein